MQPIQAFRHKRSFATHVAPDSALTHMTSSPLAAPAIGDLVVAEVMSIGKHSTIELCDGVNFNIFPGDQLLGAFGNRYATDQYEGYVPAAWGEQCDMLSVGGVFGEVHSAHRSMGVPTRLRILGAVCDANGQTLNLRSFAPPPVAAAPSGQVILVVGSAMNSGKTTTVGTLARALAQDGLRVAAAKITGTAAGKDGRFFVSCGASPVLDFTSCGFPSTYMLGRDELTALYSQLLNQLYATGPDYIVLEIADGIFQRETRMLLEAEVVRSSVDHLFFSSCDSLAAECGVRRLREEGWPVRAVSGMVTTSPLASREVEAEVGLPCLSIDQLLGGQLRALLAPVSPAPFVRSVTTAYAA